VKLFYYLLLFFYAPVVLAEDELPYPCNYYIETVDIAFNAREEKISADILTEWYAEKNIPTMHLNDHYKIISIIYELPDDELNFDKYLETVYATSYWCATKWSKQWELELQS